MVTALRLERYGPRPGALELQLDGRRLLRRYGPLDRPLEPGRTQTFDTPERARVQFDQQALRALAKGYWAGHHNPDLIAAIRRDPDDVGGFLVYGDWLLERLDPRGELIQAPDDKRPDLLWTHRMQLKPESWRGWVQADWHLGFIRRAACAVQDYSWDAHSAPHRIRRFLRHPSAHFLRELKIGWTPVPHFAAYTDGRNRAFEELWQDVLHNLPTTLTRLTIDPGPLLQLAQRTLGPDLVPPAAPERVGLLRKWLGP